MGLIMVGVIVAQFLLVGWRGGGERRYLPKASTETRCAQAVSTSSRGVLSDGYV